jgi:outer membrane protein OmpA-like peptidoglycan-associated protein
MPLKLAMALLVAGIAIIATTMFSSHFDVASLRHSSVLTVPSAKQTNEASQPRIAPSESAQTEPDSAKFDVVRIDPEGASVFAGRAPPNAQVTVLANGEMVATTKADDNGQWAAVVEHPFAPGEYQLSVRARSTGSPADTIGGNVSVTIAAKENPPPAHISTPSAISTPTAMAAAPRKETAPSPPMPITFAYNESKLSLTGQQQAVALSEFLNKQKFTSVTLSGHADERGSDEFNMELSRQRLETVAHYLYESGYTGELKLIPEGKRQPYLAPDRERLPKEDAFQLDRRVELHLR